MRGALALALLVSALVPAGAAGDAALGRVAASMRPGTWARVPQTNIDAVLGRGAHAANQLPYANAAAWDPVRQVLRFVGADHDDDATHSMSYSAATNSWTFEGSLPLAFSHGYDHVTLDPRTGVLYFRDFGIGSDGNRSWSRPPGGAWSVRTAWTPKHYIQVAIGTAWWSGRLRGAGADGALVVYNCGAQG